ncbi:IclR family transcriptional regulator [Aquamicrobium terrae]|uniref:DNA-binding IclR family transcriptional regulator n=1 Tax=Aquamicrobium terrae TaxID=1324945 RepID=A0ABV2N7E1_9HYPH
METFEQDSPDVKRVGRRGGSTSTGTAALEKGLDVLRMVAGADAPQGFADLMASTGMPRSTLHRILILLTARGLVARDITGQGFVPGIGLMELARLSWERSDVRAAASGPLRELAARVGEAVHLATLVDREVVYLDKVESEHPVRLYSAIGKRGPVHCTSVGKAMAAFLPERARTDLLAGLSFVRFTPATIVTPARMADEFKAVRASGSAFDREEHQQGVHCVAAPIFDFRGHPVAGISITAPVFRVSRDQLEAFAPMVREAAAAATAALGGRLRSVGEA